MIFRGKTFQEAVDKGLRHFGVTYDTAEVYLIKGTDGAKDVGEEGEFVVEISPLYNMPTNVDGNFRVLYKKDGVYVKVNPPVGNGMSVRAEDIRENLKYKDVKDIDEEAIIEAANVVNTETIKIAPPQEEIKHPATLEINIEKDNKSAYAVMIPPNGGDTLTKDRAVTILNKNGVVAGLNYNNIENMITKNIYGTPVLIATAVEPINGEDGYVDYKVEINKKRELKTRANGSIDFRELDLIENVVAKQTLASLVPPTEGTDGQDVLGNPIKAKAGAIARLPKGKNTEVTADNLSLIAAVDGQINFVNGRINVHPIYEVRSNVDNSTGNIRFVGKVRVGGNVLTGFEIHADGDIEVHGVVEGAKLVSGGDIILKRGAQGSGRGVLICEGTLVSRFIENCTVEAKGGITAEAIMHSVIRCKSSIELKGRKGLLVGGNISAGKEIRAKTIGSPMATATHIEVGVDPGLKTKIDDLIKKIEEEKKSLQQVESNIKLVAKIAKTGYVPENRKVLLQKCLNLKSQLEENIRQNTMKLAGMQEQLDTISTGRINVEGVVHAGTTITIGSSKMHVRDTLEYVSFYRAEGEIKLGTYGK